jgi:hypothetical protein
MSFEGVLSRAAWSLLRFMFIMEEKFMPAHSKGLTNLPSKRQSVTDLDLRGIIHSPELIQLIGGVRLLFRLSGAKRASFFLPCPE